MEDIVFEWDENKNEINKESMAYLLRKRRRCFTTITRSYSMTLTTLLAKKDFSLSE